LEKESSQACWLAEDPSQLQCALGVLADPAYEGDRFFANQGLQVIVACLDKDFGRRGPGAALVCSDAFLGSVAAGGADAAAGGAAGGEDPDGTWVLQAAMRALKEASRQERAALALGQQRLCADLAGGGQTGGAAAKAAAKAAAAAAAGLGADARVAANVARSAKAGICQLVNLVARVVGGSGLVHVVVREGVQQAHALLPWDWVVGLFHFGSVGVRVRILPCS
jgi:hypothetical protein